MFFKKFFLVFSIFFALLLTTCLIGFILSPYKSSEKYPYKVVEHNIIINTPIDSIFRMLGNSAFARQWSVFVHHIVPLNKAEISDGKPGSKRRCFAKENETGLTWDEEILIVEPNKRRRLSIYNMQGFESSSNDLLTEQLYEKIDSTTTRLTFTFFRNEEIEMEWWKQLLIYYEAYNMKSVFEKNMTNIKYLAEEGSNYKRRNEFEN